MAPHCVHVDECVSFLLRLALCELVCWWHYAAHNDHRQDLNLAWTKDERDVGQKAPAIFS